MTTIAIIGAGPNLGQSVARRFAREGFSVALLSRNSKRLDKLAVELRSDGHTAGGFVADARDPQSLRTALSNAAEQLGPIEILQYSPVPAKEFMRPVLDTTAADDLAGPVEMSIYGPVTAVTQVLPGMRSLGHGTILIVNGASAVKPNGTVTGTSIAFAGESAYAQMLYDAITPEGIHVAQLIVPLGIGGGDPAHEPAAIADTLWQLHASRDEFRTFLTPLN